MPPKIRELIAELERTDLEIEAEREAIEIISIHDARKLLQFQVKRKTTRKVSN